MKLNGFRDAKTSGHAFEKVLRADEVGDSLKASLVQQAVQGIKANKNFAIFS